MIGNKLELINNLEKLESEHYIFYFEKDSLAKKDIEKIEKEQENCYYQITKTLKIDFKGKITYYLCDNPEMLGIIYGDNEPCNGFADARNNAIYAVYNENIKCIGAHEDAHIISYLYNRPDSAAIREGLAMYFDQVWWDIDNYVCTKIYYDNGKYHSILQMIKDEIFYDIPCEISYPIVGAFTDYVISRCGIDKYIDFYKNKNIMWEKYLGISINDLEKGFLEKIQNLKLDSNTRINAENVLFKQ